MPKGVYDHHKIKKPKETRVCALSGCDVTFEVSVTSRRKYCCHRCSTNDRRNKPRSKEVREKIGSGNKGVWKTKVCVREGCENVFETRASENYKYCNQKCWWLDQKGKRDSRIELVCQQCYTKFKRYSGYTKYCSNKCSGKARKGVKRGPQSKESNEKRAKTHKKLWEDPTFREEHIKFVFNSLRIRPTKPEKQLNKILHRLFPNQWKYVGDGSFIVGYKNPDFVNINGQKKIIEMNGDYWHSEKRTGRTKEAEEQQRVNLFARYGYQTLIIWEHELDNIDNVISRITEFSDARYT